MVVVVDSTTLLVVSRTQGDQHTNGNKHKTTESDGSLSLVGNFGVPPVDKKRSTTILYGDVSGKNLLPLLQR